ncbi:MAG: aspartate carbamoyltransferase catalytic subunit [Calditrichaeota bacterium]|nr:MAG: aspartate carbamoyltransferase catalytic subunit [Calditrichota bacterium]
MFSRKHLLGLDGVAQEEIISILDTARSFREVLERPIKRLPTLQGKTVVNLFYEPSTRTRISFELAEKRLSADIVNFSASASSVKKGETLIDTVRNIEAMKIDMVVVRHSSPGAAHLLARVLNAHIINAGDGGHEHPTQALLDMFTIREKKGRLDQLTVALVGDISHSRVAMSNIYGLRTMGARVLVCGPSTLIPRHIEWLGVEVYHNIDEIIEQVDVMNILRLQLERQRRGLFPSLREYHNYFGITRERLERATRPILIMHPGPMNRGVEISSDVADSEHSVILEQVTNGLAVRMAILYLLAGGKSEIH